MASASDVAATAQANQPTVIAASFSEFRAAYVKQELRVFKVVAEVRRTTVG